MNLYRWITPNLKTREAGYQVYDVVLLDEQESITTQYDQLYYEAEQGGEREMIAMIGGFGLSSPGGYMIT